MRNHKLKIYITGFTPNKAKKHENHIHVKINLELHAKKKRNYPDINIGDSVIVFQKKIKLLIKRESIDGQQNNIQLKI